jgi:hypothetical protein
VSYIGFRTNNIEIKIGENETINIDIQIPPASLSLDEIIVSASTETVMTNLSKIDVTL